MTPGFFWILIRTISVPAQRDDYGFSILDVWDVFIGKCFDD